MLPGFGTKKAVFSSVKKPIFWVANITNFSVEVRNLENDPYFFGFLYGVSKFSDFSTDFAIYSIFFNIFHRNW